jgi:S1-C subfamily serine protease
MYPPPYPPPPANVPPPFYGPGMPPPPPPPPPRRGWLLGIALGLVLLMVIGATAFVIVLGALRQPDQFGAGPEPGANPTQPQSSDGSGQALPQPVAPQTQNTGPIDTNAVTAAVNPSVVDINTTLGFANARAAGTGMVLTANGLVLTNNHVIAGETDMTVTTVVNGHTYSASVLGYDRTEDVAVVQLKNASGLKPITAGDSDQVQPGDRIVAIGNAGGAGGAPSVAPGVVEALNRTITASDELDGSTNQLTGLIQIQAQIVAGDSGGPLADRSGHVIGMNTAASSGFNMQTAGGRGFAVPIKTALDIAQKIISGQSAGTTHVGPTALLGVRTSSTPRGNGAAVASVVSDGPAENAGLAAGDLIVGLNSTTVTSPTDLSTAINQFHPGDKATLVWIDRFGQQHSGTVTFGTGPPA